MGSSPMQESHELMEKALIIGKWLIYMAQEH